MTSKIFLIAQFFDCAIGTTSFKMFMVNQKYFLYTKWIGKFAATSLRNYQREAEKSHESWRWLRWSVPKQNHLQGHHYVNLKRWNNFMWIRSAVASFNNGTVWHEDRQTMINCEKDQHELKFKTHLTINSLVGVMFTWWHMRSLLLKIMCKLTFQLMHQILGGVSLFLSFLLAWN